MNTEKLTNKLATSEIKQTSNKREVIPFRDSAIEKITKTNTKFNLKRFKEFKFDVSKGSSLKGLVLRFSKATEQKAIVLNFWFNSKPGWITLGTYPNIRCKDIEKICLNLTETHQDHRGLWIKSPIITRSNEKRIVEKPDTATPTGKTINEVIEAYCGSDGERGFLKDYKEGHRTSKSIKNWFRYMAGYNKRQSMVTWYDDEDGGGVVKFLPNLHYRTIAPKDWADLFRKFPPGTGILKDREYYNRRSKISYTKTASKNYSIYDSKLGKSLIHELTTGDIEAWLRGITSQSVKEEYVMVFTTLWIYARKRGWLGTDPGRCPIDKKTVYIKREPKKDDPYKDVSISEPMLNVFFEASEELSERFPFKAELHEFAVLTGIRKTEALKVKKSFIDWEQMLINIPKGISKSKKKDEVVYITPELEIVLRNILDMGKRPGLEHYNMRDFPWLFATRKWSADKYFNVEFRLGPRSRLGGDENYIPALRQLMRDKMDDQNLIYSFKVLRKTYTTLSQKRLEGRSDKVKHLTRHTNEATLDYHYNKPQRAEVRDYANTTTSNLHFIKRRA